MNTREIASEYRLSHWAGILQERKASGLRVKEYCKTAGIHENVYYYWQRKLREAACAELAVNTTAESAKSLVPGGWSVCRTDDGNSNRKSLVVEVGGCRVHVEPDSDPELLAKICRALKSLC